MVALTENMHVWLVANLRAIRVWMVRRVIHSHQSNIPVAGSQVQPNFKWVSLERQNELNLLVLNRCHKFVLPLVHFPNECITSRGLFGHLDQPVSLFLGDHFVSSNFLTTSNSFPRGSITFTAICLCSPAGNGALVVPAR